MKDFFKKYVLGFVLGALIFGPLSYVTATTIAARNITYNGANTNSSLTDVQAAIEQLYNMSETKPLITFIVNGTTYQAEQGMTWNTYISSSYNTLPFRLSVSLNGAEDVVCLENMSCLPEVTDKNSLIINNKTYTYDSRCIDTCMSGPSVEPGPGIK